MPDAVDPNAHRDPPRRTNLVNLGTSIRPRPVSNLAPQGSRHAKFIAAMGHVESIAEK
jgi:hypothetical protein